MIRPGVQLLGQPGEFFLGVLRKMPDGLFVRPRAPAIPPDEPCP